MFQHVAVVSSLLMQSKMNLRGLDVVVERMEVMAEGRVL